MPINLVPQSTDLSGANDNAEDPRAANRRKVLAAQLLQKKAGDPQNMAPGWSKIAAGALGGFMEGIAEREEREAQAKSNEGLMNLARALQSNTGATANGFGTPANSPGSPPGSTGAAPSFAGGGQTRAMAMPAGAAGDIKNAFMSTVQGGGLTNPFGLAAVAAYGNAESGFSPKNMARTWSDPSESSQPGTSGGLMSWRDGRLAKLRQFTGGDLSPENQARFFLNEDPQLIAKLNAAKSPEEANALMANAWKFAGYDRPGGENARRLEMTRQFVPLYGSKGGAAPVQATPASAPAGNPAADLPAPGAQEAGLSLGIDGFFTPPAPPTREAYGADYERAVEAYGREMQARGLPPAGAPSLAETEADVRSLEAGMMPPAPAAGGAGFLDSLISGAMAGSAAFGGSPQAGAPNLPGSAPIPDPAAFTGSATAAPMGAPLPQEGPMPPARPDAQALARALQVEEPGRAPTFAEGQPGLTPTAGRLPPQRPADLPAPGAQPAALSPQGGPGVNQNALAQALMGEMSPQQVLQLDQGGAGRRAVLAGLLQGNPATATATAPRTMRPSGSEASPMNPNSPASRIASPGEGLRPPEPPSAYAQQPGMGAAPLPTGSQMIPAQIPGQPSTMGGGSGAGVGGVVGGPSPTVRDAAMAVLNDPRQSAQAKAFALSQLNPKTSQVDLGDTIGIMDERGNVLRHIPKSTKPELREINGRLVEYQNGQARDVTPECPPSGYRPITDPAERQRYGIPPNDTRPYQVGPNNQVSSPGGGTTVNMPAGEKAEEVERAKGLAKRLGDIADDGKDADADLAAVQRLDELLRTVEPGARTAAMEWFRQRTGVALDPNADNVQAASALIDYLVPRQRVPGSGASSDRDMATFRAALPSLKGTPEGNGIVLQTIGGLAGLRQQRARIAEAYQLGDIDAREAQRLMRELPDPFTGFREWQAKQGKNSPGGSGAGQARSAPQASPSGPQSSPGAAGQPVQVQSKTDYDRLPSGAQYVAPDGNVRTKK